jgi:hypothetical protein
MVTLGALLLVTTTALLAEYWGVAQVAYASQFIVLLQFALRRFRTRGAHRRPPAAFVLIPLGFFHGIAGAALIATSALTQIPPWAFGLGRLLVEQGVFLCFAVGIGSLVLPLMGGMPPPPDWDVTARQRVRAVVYAGAGVLICASLIIESIGWVRVGPLLRAGVVAAGIGFGAGAWRAPAKPGLHRRLVSVSGLLPDYRVPALHILFIGGFSLMAFGVATHVVFSHLDLEHLALGRPTAIAVLGVSFLLALLTRLAADASATYFQHLAWAASLWLVGSGVWLASLAPKLLRR